MIGRLLAAVALMFAWTLLAMAVAIAVNLDLGGGVL